MFDRIRHNEGGFTLVELLIVLIILALLVAIVIPAVAGFLGRGEEQSFDADKRNLQAAVDAYYTDNLNRTATGFRQFPTDWNGGVVTKPDELVVINMDYMTDQVLMRDMPGSAGLHNGNSTPGGSYTWVIDSNDGEVLACQPGEPISANGAADGGEAGPFDEAGENADATGCVTGYADVYP